MHISVRGAAPIIETMNVYLTQKCDGMSIGVKPFNNLLTSDAVYDGLRSTVDGPAAHWIVCLNHHKTCISSIACKQADDGSFEISSFTMPMYEGRKYNLLLRAATMVIAPYITFNRNSHPTVLVSRPVNPVSTYTLVKYFNAQNPTIEAYLNAHGLTSKTVKMSDIKALYEEMEPPSMTDSEEMNYMKTHDDYGKPLVLTVALPIEMDVFTGILRSVTCMERRSVRLSKKSRKKTKKSHKSNKYVK